MRYRILRSCVVAVLCVSSVLAFDGLLSGHSAFAVEVNLQNTASRPLGDVPVTFGQVFRKGEFPGEPSVWADGRMVSAQIDAKRHYDDGSLRFAIVSTRVPKRLAPGEAIVLDLKPASTSDQAAAASHERDLRRQLLADNFDAMVKFTFPDGTVRSIHAQDLLRSPKDDVTTWLSGPLAAEWLFSGSPVDSKGQPDEDLQVHFQVRAYAGSPEVRVSVAVENCQDSWAGNVRYDVSVAIDAKEVFARKAVDHRRLSRWRKVFWCRGEDTPCPRDVHVMHDLAYLSATGALPNYDRTLPKVDPRSGTGQMSPMQGPNWDILGRGPLTAYMPTTGGRPEIAPYPIWTVRYLLGMDRAAKDFVLRAGDLAGSWPIHVRSQQTGRIMTIDQRPKFWLDQRGEDRPQWKPDRHAPAADQTRLSPDLAHQGSFAYVPYLMTGDYYYLEEAYFWANYCLLATWSHPRKDAEGILSGQRRGNAWALRNIADAQWIAADGHPEADYFAEKIQNNLDDRIQRMYGPPEYSRRGAWGIRTTESMRIHNPPNSDWMLIAPWEHDYLIWSLHHLVELGHADAARVRDYLLRLRVGTLTNAPDFNPLLAAPYRFVVGEQASDKTVVFYDDWKRLGQENARLTKPEAAGKSNDYAYSARAAVVCGVDGRFPQAAEALTQIEAQFPDLRAVMTRNPAWAILPVTATSNNR